MSVSVLLYGMDGLRLNVNSYHEFFSKCGPGGEAKTPMGSQIRIIKGERELLKTIKLRKTASLGYVIRN